MSNVGFSKGVLEVAKFAVYVSVPVFLMSFAADTKFLHKLTGKVTSTSPPPTPTPLPVQLGFFHFFSVAEFELDSVCLRELKTICWI
ncbi:hypothetical protein LINGRAHAP2_LOCUS15543 [Linum grandiflorum]